MREFITAVILTSPIPEHPKTDRISETIGSIRYHLPDSKIFIFADGVRDEERDRQAAYMEYLGRLTSEILNSSVAGDAYLCASYEHVHQIGLMRKYFDWIRTPLLLFMEHDTPLTADPIDWFGIANVLLNTDVEYIRFNPETQIPAEHSHLMLGEICPYGVPLMRTIQFHARPHVATKKFYERLLGRFSFDANCFIEDFAHGVCQANGADSWHEWPLTIYTPPGNQKRSMHTNGREGSRKFDELQSF